MPGPLRRARPLLGTFVEVAVAGAAPAVMEAAVEAAFDAVAAVHALMSFHEAGSDVSRLNRDAAVRPVEVHSWTYDVLAAAADLHRGSAGAFDICVAPALQRLGLLPNLPVPGASTVCTPSTHDGRTPSPPSSGGEGRGEGGAPQGQTPRLSDIIAASLERGGRAALESFLLLEEASALECPVPSTGAALAAPHPDPLPPKRGEREQAGRVAGAVHDNVQLLPGNLVRFADAAVKIDLGGIAKGYAVDRAIEALQRHGMTEGIVNAGGDLRAFGPHPHAVDIRDPLQPERTIFRVFLKDGALASSAGRFDPMRSRQALASAVIDPATAMPAAAIRGATVCAPRCVLADALTKVVMNAGEDAGTVLEHYGADALFVSSLGEAHLTANWKNEVHLAA